jgi:hypothetical protein
MKSTFFQRSIGLGLFISFVFIFGHKASHAQYARSVHGAINNGAVRNTEAIEINNEILFVNIKFIDDTLRLSAAKIDANGETYGYKFQNILGISGNYFCFSGIALSSDNKIILNILALNGSTANKMVYVKYNYENGAIEDINVVPTNFHKAFTRSRQKGDSLITYHYDNDLAGFYRIACSINTIQNRNVTLVSNSLTYSSGFAWTSGVKNTELIIDASGNEYVMLNSTLMKRTTNATYISTSFTASLTYGGSINFDDSGNILVLSTNNYSNFDNNLNLISQGIISGIPPNNNRFNEHYFKDGQWIVYSSIPNSTNSDRIVLNSNFNVDSIYASEYSFNKVFNVFKGLNSIYVIGNKLESYYQQSNLTVAVVKDNDPSNIKPFIDFNQTFEHGQYKFHTGQFNTSFWSPNPNSGLFLKHQNVYKRLIFSAYNNLVGTLSNGESEGLISTPAYQNTYVGPYTPIQFHSVENFDKYSRGYYVDKDMISYHMWNFTDPTYQIPFGIREWPAHGDPAKGQSFNLAPFVDFDNDGLYSPENGDYPAIYGDRCVLNLYNHNKDTVSTLTLPYGLESYQYYYVFDCDTSEVLKNTIFLTQRFKLVLGQLNNAIVGTYLDYDIGNYADDYIGTHVELGMVYSYNSDLFDQSDGGMPGFENYPPASGMMILKGSKLDPDQMDNPIGINPNESISGSGFGDGIEDNEYFTLESSIKYPNNILSNDELVNLFQGLDASGNYAQVSGVDVRFAYFGNSDPDFYGSWGIDHGNNYTELIAGNPAGDNRLLCSSGKSNLNSADPNNNTYEIVTAYITAIDSIIPNTNVLNMLFNYGSQLKSLYNNGSDLCGTYIGPTASLSKTENQNIKVYPNPTDGIVQIEMHDQSEIEYLLLNGQGMILEQGNKKGPNLNISLLNYPSGLYIIKINGQPIKILKR